MIQLTPPCEYCPIHWRGLEKSGPVCRTCAARSAYVAAIGDEDILMGRKPAPDLTPPPEADRVFTVEPSGNPQPSGTQPSGMFGRRKYSIGPYRRQKPKKKRPVGRPTTCRTVMAARRVELGIGQEDLTDMVCEIVGRNVTRRTIAGMEGGNYPYNPKEDTMAAIAQVLKIPADTLLLPVNQRKEPTPCNQPSLS